MTRLIRIFLSLPLCLAAVAGCTSSTTPTTVSGKITFNGNSVSGGTLGFYPTAEGLQGALPTNINKDGTYLASGVVPGEVIVTVETESLSPEKPQGPLEYGATRGRNAAKNKMPAGGYQKILKDKGKLPAEAESGKQEALYVKIPSKYSDKKTSPLKFTVKKGSNTFNIELKDD